MEDAWGLDVHRFAHEIADGMTNYLKYKEALGGLQEPAMKGEEEFFAAVARAAEEEEQAALNTKKEAEEYLPIHLSLQKLKDAQYQARVRALPSKLQSPLIDAALRPVENDAWKAGLAKETMVGTRFDSITAKHLEGTSRRSDTLITEEMIKDAGTGRAEEDHAAMSKWAWVGAALASIMSSLAISAGDDRIADF